MNMMRLSISLLLGLAFGLFCAYGTMNVNIPGLAITAWILLATVYNRILIGFFIGVVEDVVLIRQHELLNAALRGGLMGFIISLAMVIPSSWSSLVPILFGIAYGIVIDVAATKFAPPKEVVCYSAKPKAVGKMKGKK